MAARGKHARSPLNDLQKVRKQQIIDYIRQYREQNYMSPTLREIAVAIGYEEESYGSVHPLIKDLINKGFLVRAAKGARTLMLAEPQPAPYFYRREDAIRALKAEVKKSPEPVG